MGKGLKSSHKLLIEKIKKNHKMGRANEAAFKRMRLKPSAKINTLPYVSNVLGSSGKRCPCKCRSWLDHWAQGAKVAVIGQKCFVRGCSNMASVGAHVHIKGGGNKQHILPFCSFHNGRAVTIALILKAQKLRLAISAYDRV